MAEQEHEITNPGPVLDGKGHLREPGFARKLILNYDRKQIKAAKSRIKEWDYYAILSGDLVLALTIDDNGYMGLLSATVLVLGDGDRAAGSEAQEPGNTDGDRGEVTESVMCAFPMGRVHLPADSASGITQDAYKGCAMRFEAHDGVRTIRASWPNFGAMSHGRAERLFGKPASRIEPVLPTPQEKPKAGAVGLQVEITLTEQEPRESMVIATPWAGNPRAFYYNQKINCQDAVGWAQVGARRIEFSKGRSFGVLDWGRGVWTWKNTWIWGSSSGLAALEGQSSLHSFGFNIGYGFGDTSASSENMVFLDGSAHKIGHLHVDIDDSDYCRPWHAKSDDARFDLTMTPLLDRASNTDMLIIGSDQHQVFGKWNGTVTLEDGRRIQVRNLLGFCEKVKNKW